MAIAIILAVVAFFAVAAFTSYLVSTNFDERSGTSVIQHRVLQVVPLHSFKSIIVVWQIVTQASGDCVFSLPVQDISYSLYALRTSALGIRVLYLTCSRVFTYCMDATNMWVCLGYQSTAP